MVPRSPLASWLKLPSKDRVTPQAYVDELLHATEQIYETVRKAQQERSDENQAKAMKGHIPSPLSVGQLVLLRRPPAAVRHDGEERSISRKLQSKARPEAYQVIKRVGDANYILGDVATGEEVTAFKQPEHADRLVLVEGSEFPDTPAEVTRVEIEGVPGVLKRQAWDGRVLIEMGSRAQEDAFVQRYATLGAKRAIPPEKGVWADLARFDYHFVEHRESEDTIGSMSEGETDFHRPSRLTTASHSMLKATRGITRLVLFLVSLLSQPV